MTCCLLLVLCVVPWRQKSYFSGSLDPVVLAKGALGVAALTIAANAARRSRRGHAIGTRTIVIAASYLVASVVGGWAAGSTVPAAVIAVRVAMLVMSIAFLASAFETDRLIASVVGSLASVAAVSAVTGVGTLRSGRLEGGLPSLASNEIAFACGVVVLFVMHHAKESVARVWHLAAGVTGFAVMWLTGSRTTTATFVVAAFVLILQSRVLSVPAFITCAAAVPVAAWVALSTPVITELLFRGGSSNVTTLSSRTIAWQAALSFDGATFQKWFGGGLALKYVPVSGQYWQTQLLDSSWISALVQVGFVGLALAALWVCLAFVGAMASPRPWRPLWLALLVFMVPRSALESGLFDASAAFIVFALVSLQVEPAAHSPAPAAPDPVRESA
ncbi:hypothetical protein ASC58_14150 [Phycicoccus sp. Root101]|nr:hypothetical protein ASC58_14150 [Phycicoccus sp. Root101]